MVSLMESFRGSEGALVVEEETDVAPETDELVVAFVFVLLLVPSFFRGRVRSLSGFGEGEGMVVVPERILRSSIGKGIIGKLPILWGGVDYTGMIEFYGRIA